jgi:TOMM system kinase/cyclase fusion protein
VAKQLHEKSFIMNPKSEGREKTRGRFFVSSIIGTSPRIQEVIRLIEKVSDSPLGVLITGESGTGKELVARTIHYNSSRFGKPFIDINCAALPESLLESELFGIEKGVATGVERRVGKIEMANGGTLFLDEIGDMSLPAQTKLLRVLQERKMERVGGRSAINVDVRVIAATNKDLKEEIKKGSFREDLYYRLNVIHIHMPPLREMKEDIPLLAQYFLSSFANEVGRGSMHFSSHAMECLVNYGWPGNVRELENEVRRAATLTDSDVIDESDLSENVRSVAQKSPVSGRGVLQYPPTEKENQSLKDVVEEYEIRLIREALEENKGNKQKTSKILGLTRQGLIRKLKKHEERILVSKSTEIGKQTGKQENKSAYACSEPVEPLTPKKTIRPDSRQPERRHLTVMFCDLVGFTAISEQIDPEDLHEIVRAYLDVCSKVIRRFEGHITKYFGDGLLVYFGYPSAHEDDAQRAVRTALEIVEAIQKLPLDTRIQIPLQVRVGIHTGLVVIGGMGVENVLESIAIVGETPNVATQLLSVAEPNTVVISSATYQLVEGLFEYHYLGLHTLKGFSTPLDVYRVLHESGIQSRFDVAITKGLTPLVGREREVGLLLERWEQVKERRGQVVLINGEPGIGKSRLVQALKEQLTERPHVKIEIHCSPYYQNSALYPVINHLERLMRFKREDSPEEKLEKLERALVGAGFKPAPTQELGPLFASLLSMPLSKDYSPLNSTPQRQKQKILETLLSWLLKDAEKQPVLFIVEDLQWIDPSTLEFLNLVMDKSLTSRILILLTFRPDFHPPWTSRVHLTQITLNRLAQKQVEYMIERLVGGKSLPTEVLRRLIAKTDGIPLFVEELTKMVLESGLLREEDGQYKLTAPLPFLTIPASLQDSLMARLDRLGTVKEVAQLGATLGREFTYELLQSVSSLDEATLKRGLNRLVEAELLYQSGTIPQAKYSFKHALIQEAAYQSLLKSKRQQYHKRIAKVVEEQFPETTETQPELLAHHYTEAVLIEQAIPYWQKAGERARQRSANMETIGHLTKGLELLSILPDTPERNQKELSLQTTLGPALIAIKGYAAPEVEKAYARAHELCCQMGETPQIFPVLSGLRGFYVVRAEYGAARELGEQLLCLAQRQQDTAFLLEAHRNLGSALVWLGELVPAQAHLEQGIALYDRQQHRSHIFLYGQDPGVASLAYLSWILLLLGYPDQALKTIHEALTLARELSHPYSLAYALHFVPGIHQFLREELTAQGCAEELITLSSEQGFAYWLGWGKILRGWALAQQGKAEEGITQMHQGLTAHRATGARLALSHFLALLSEAYGKVGQAEKGLAILAEGLAVVRNTGERFYEVEIYRLKGELILALSQENQSEAERCFRQAIDIARHQSAKFLELRAVISLSRLWKKQGKKEEAQEMLAEIYGWFTEGFNTADLIDAKALLGEPL